MKETPLIFSADDQPDVIDSLRLLLKKEGYSVEGFDGPDDLIATMHTRQPDLILLDLNYARDTTSGREGLDAIARIRSFDTRTPIVAMTAWGSIELAVRAIRQGAQDFIEKPWVNERVAAIVRDQVEMARSAARAAGTALDAETNNVSSSELVAGSAAMRRVVEVIDRIAPSKANVLLTGESGSGKGLVARMIHAHSRRSGSFVRVNMGGLADSLFESEMFGHVKGAFTDAKAERVGRFEFAHGGTLFLDEIGNLGLTQQARLLHVLEDGHFEPLGASESREADVRLIAATNADLKEEIEQGRFRRDLLYRLNTIHIHLPPLRQRGEDILRLAKLFLTQHAAKHGRRIPRLSEESEAVLRQYAWPGNIRELSHCVERAVLLAVGDSLEVPDLRLEPEHSSSQGRRLTMEEIERRAISAALARSNGSVVDAAVELGVSRSALYRRMEKFQL